MSADVAALFWHSPIHLPASGRQLFRRDLAAPAFEAAVRAAPIPVRQDIARLLAAALLAERGPGVILCVEGWHHNAVERPFGRAPHVMTGSRFCGLLLRMLQRRGLAARRLRLLRRDHSVCTLEEVEAMWSAARQRRPEPRLTAVAGFYCPSAGRADAYLRRATAGRGRAYRPGEALRRAGIALTPEQQRLLDASRLSAGEAARGVVLEAINWSVHAVSAVWHAVDRSGRPLEVRMARRLRGPRQEAPTS